MTVSGSPLAICAACAKSIERVLPECRAVGLSGPEVSAKRMEDAADCHSAKALALRAQTEQEIDVALKMVRSFCES